MNKEQNDLKVLLEAFDNFKKNTDKLQTAYNFLQKKVESLNTELEERNIQLKESLNTIEEMKKFSDSILLHINSGVIAIDTTGIIQIFNKNAENFFNLKSENVINKNYKEVFSKIPEDLSLLKVLQEQNEIAYSDIEFDYNNIHTHINYNAKPVFDNENRLLGSVQIFRDLTEIKELEKIVQRQKTLAALGEMAANVAHEIRNPLGGIEGFASLLKRKVKDEKNKKIADRIVDGVRNLNSIITNLLYYTRPMSLNLMNLNIQNLIMETVNHIKSDNNPIIENVDFVYLFSDDFPEISADPQKLKQVFFNLIYNAVHSLNKYNKEVKIRTDSFEKRVIVEIEDNGCGIEENLQEKVFNPFFTTKDEGTGLGLAITMKIIETHNGKIEIVKSDNEGTKFKITLPSNLSK